MHIALLLVLVLMLVFGPQWWARYTFRRYAGASPNVPGTGAELARHLLNRFGMEDVGVEPAEQGADHYDPEQRMVRLGPDNYNGKSLTAVAVAAHEVGHAFGLAHENGRENLMAPSRHGRCLPGLNRQQVEVLKANL